MKCHQFHSYARSRVQILLRDTRQDKTYQKCDLLVNIIHMIHALNNWISVVSKHTVLPCRIPQLGIHVDPGTSSGRKASESTTSPLMNGEKSKLWDQIGGQSALASPMRREIGNRHVSFP